MVQKQEQATAGRHERMSAVDTAWLRMDGPDNAMVIVSVTATATPVDFAAFRHVLATRLMCFPRFRHRPIRDPLGASWMVDESFELDSHLVRTDLPEPRGKAELEAFAAHLASVQLDPAHPLWQVHFVEKYLSGSAWVMSVDRKRTQPNTTSRNVSARRASSHRAGGPSTPKPELGSKPVKLLKRPLATRNGASWPTRKSTR